MYVGNIVSLFGLALIIDSLEAIALFIICVALQIGRAIYEERLLHVTLSDYAAYEAKVGRFVPRFDVLKGWSAKTAILLCGMFFVKAVSTSAIAEAIDNQHCVTERCPPKSSISGSIHLARQTPNLDKRCADWHAKALSGGWFNHREVDDLNNVGEELENTAIPACMQFNALQSKCTFIVNAWPERISNATFMQRLEATKGCLAMAGYDNICKAVEGLMRAGVALTDSRKTLALDCYQSSLRTRRVEFLRPAI
jgi:hypothetical protein